MPFITIKLLEGRTVQQKVKTAKEVTDVIVKNLNVTKDKVYVIFEELKHENYAPHGEINNK